jgi:hypothetical protein
MEKRADWQEYLDKKNNRKDYLTDEQIEQQRLWQQQQQEQQGKGADGSGGAAVAAEGGTVGTSSS